MLKREEIKKISDVLLKSRKIAIVSHYNPDGDAVGSSLSLYLFFKNAGYDVKAILPNPFPDFLNWMSCSSEIIISQSQRSEAKKAIRDADILFIVDMNAPHRCGKELENLIVKSKSYKILIDHHLQPEIDADVIFSTTKTTSTCELVYNFLFFYLRQKDRLTKEIAECIYTGIITDTGSLCYSCNYPDTYLVISKLISMGIDGEAIHRSVYDNYSEARMKLLGLSLSSRFKVIPESKTSYIYLSKKDLELFNYQVGDTEGIVNYGISIKSVVFTAFFVERDNRIRISFRSKGDFDVNLFARQYFNGGGHRNASGADYYDTLENTILYFEKIVKDLSI